MSRYFLCIQRILLAMIFMWTASCTFESEEEFFIEVDQSEIVIPTIDFNSSSDTIYIRGEVNIGVNISQDVDLLEYKVFIGNIEVGNGDYHNGFVRVDSEEFSDGYHFIVLEVYTKSNTGSLGDQLEIEVVVTETQKVVHVDNAPIVPQVKGFENVDGVLTLNWDEYSSFQFEEYEVVFYAPYYSSSQTITSPEQTSATVPSYVGGDIEAKFYLRAKGEEVSTTVYFSDDLDIEMVLIDNEVQLSISPNTYEAFDRYELEHDNSIEEFESPVRYPIENRLYDNEPLAINFEYPVNYIFTVYGISSSGEEVYLGGANFNSERYPIDYDDGLRYYFFENSILHYKTRSLDEGDQAILYNRSDGELIGQLSGNMALSPDGNQLYEYQNGTIIRYNPATLEGVDAFDLDLSMEGEFRRLYVSNTGTLLFYNQISYNPYSTDSHDRSYLYDSETHSLVKTWSHFSTLLPVTVSSALGSNGLMVNSNDFFISYHASNPNKVPSFYSGVSSSQNELSGASGRMVAPLHTSDFYLVAEGNTITKRDYVYHNVQMTENLTGEIYEIFSNFDDLCSVILEEDSNYYLVILDTSTLEEVDRIPFNSTVLNGQKYMTDNRVFIEGRGFYVYDLEVNR